MYHLSHFDSCGFSIFAMNRVNALQQTKQIGLFVTTFVCNGERTPMIS